MDISIDNDEGLDFGTLVFQPDRDDSFEVYSNGIITEIRIPLYNHEAREVIEVLQTIADREDQ